MGKKARYWQVGSGSHGRDYAEDFLRYGLAFVGGDVHVETTKKIEVGERTQIDQELEQPTTWHKSSEKRAVIYVRHAGDIKNRDDWPRQHEWLKTNLELFDRVFRKRIKNLDATEYVAEDEGEA